MVPHSSKCEVPLLGAQCANSEEQSDVVFWVCAGGGAGERWRVPGHRRVLAAASPVFAAMLQGPLAEGREVPVSDVEPRAFDLLLRHIYGEKVNLQSVDTALLTLYAAHKYECLALEHQCLIFLFSHIDHCSVLTILRDISVYCNLLVTPTADVPSAPSWDVIESNSEEKYSLRASACAFKEDSSQKECKHPFNGSLISSSASACNSKQVSSHNSFKVPVQQVKTNQSEISAHDISQDYKIVMNRCLQFIDLNADKVLQQELLDELGQDELLSIVQRDTLSLSSEMVLFKALEQWSRSACKRNGWELSPSNCRRALGDKLLFSVRYLLMSSEEFLISPMQSKLLSSEESNFLLGHILNHTVIPSTALLEELVPALSKHRRKSFTEIHSRSCSKHWNSACKEKISIKQPGNVSQVNTKPKKLFKKKKDSNRKEDMRLQERKPNMSDYFFSCIACIFD